MFRRIFVNILLAVVALAQYGCGSDDQFRVEGTIDGKPTMNLRVVYYDGTRLRSLLTAAKEGKFTFAGAAAQPTVVGIYDNEYRCLARTYVANGDHLELKIDRNNSYALEASGNDVAKEWARVVRDNADVFATDAAAANDVVAAYVAAHRDKLVSTLLLTRNFDMRLQPQRADSLLEILSPDVRPALLTEMFDYSLSRYAQAARSSSASIDGLPFFDTKARRDSVDVSRRQLTMLVLSHIQSGSTDSVAPMVRDMARRYRDNVQFYDISLDFDTTVWKRSLETPAEGVTYGWIAGSLADPMLDSLGIYRLPFVAVVDTTGQAVLTTSSTSAAARFVEQRLKK